MNKNKNQERKFKYVYKMSYAMELMRLGHKVYATSPNPRNNKYIMWIFEDDDTFYEDFKKLQGGSRNE